jgi:serine/threonine protein phosphatase PrpC
MTQPVRSCPDHGPPAEPDHRFCEVCGRDLVTGEPAATVAQPAPAAPPVSTPTPAASAVIRWLSSRQADPACPACGATGPGDDGYCDHCGRRRVAGRDHAELDLGTVAGVTDRARRRHNEDAFAIGRLDPAAGGSVAGPSGASAAVVCDGVSTSARSDLASHAAAEAGLAELLAALDAGEQPEVATSRGGRAAALAVRAVAAPHDQGGPPSCTYVSAVVTPDAITVGWIGDSRAYWLSSAADDSACLTIDDSLVGRLSAGDPVPSVAAADPRSRALIRWLGADSDDAEPQVATVQPAVTGRLVLCSDGLSHYLPDPVAMAQAVGDTQAPVDVARRLTDLALAAGGHDNIAVVVLPFPPTAGDDTSEGPVR